MTLSSVFEHEGVTLYLGDAREIVPRLGRVANLVMLDPPYGVTNLPWDKAESGWLDLAACALLESGSCWHFGSMRSLLGIAPQLEGWALADDVVWEKHNGSDLIADRFRRVHEHAIRLYRGKWSDTWHQAPTENTARARVIRMQSRPSHWHGERGSTVYTSDEGGPKLVRSVIRVRSMHRLGVHPTEKPVELMRLLIAAACPPGGLVLDPACGSGSALVAARSCGCRSIGVEMDPTHYASAARRCAQGELDLTSGEA